MRIEMNTTFRAKPIIKPRIGLCLKRPAHFNLHQGAYVLLYLLVALVILAQHVTRRFCDRNEIALSYMFFVVTKIAKL